MTLSRASLKQKIVTVVSSGSVTSGTHARNAEMAETIANAVVDEFTQNDQVQVTGYSSAGTYKVT
ncbi:TPA: hypothetical protein ACVO0G_001524 [Vibrio diabolicus]